MQLSHSARAFYSSSALPVASQCRYRQCDQCEDVELPPIKHKLCGGCKTAQYCSLICQKLNWPSHKAICKHTAGQVTQSIVNAAADGIKDENLAEAMRKFTSVHSILLTWAGFQALKLMRFPENVEQNAFLIVLQYRAHTKTYRRFLVSSTHVVPRTYVHDSIVADDIRRREKRCQQSAGIGVLVVIIQCGSTSQVMPVEVYSPKDTPWATCSNWLAVLSEQVMRG